MKKFNTKYTIIILLAIALIVIIGITFTYLNKAKYFGKIKIQTPENTTYSITGISPLGNQLTFDKKNDFYFYNYDRFYSELAISTKDKHSLKEITIILNDVCYPTQDLPTDISYQNGLYICKLNFSDYNYPLYEKVLDIVIFIYIKFEGTIYLILSIQLLVFLLSIIIYNKNKISIFFKHILRYIITELPKNIVSCLICALCIIITLIYTANNNSNEYGTLDNTVHLNHIWDQYDYHTTAINYANGLGFFKNGEILKLKNYHIETPTSERVRSELFYRSGYTTFRSPGFTLYASTIYRIFGDNPLAIKILNILLLLTIVFFTPKIAIEILGTRGFWAGIIAAPLIYLSFLKYAFLVEPETLTTAINFAFIYFYILMRKKKTWKLYAVSGLLLGIGILVKASLTLVIPLFFIDLILISFKDRNFSYRFLKPILFLACFLVLWLPYNIYINQYYSKLTAESTAYLASLKNKGLDYTRLCDYPTLKVYSHIEPNICNEDVTKFFTQIEPKIDSLLYLPQEYYQDSNKLNHPLSYLANIKLLTIYNKPFYMQPAIPIIYLLGFHNEYYDGRTQRHNDWVNDPNSYYNSIEKTPSFIKSWTNFYINNPTYIVKNLYYKLKYAHAELWIIYVFIFSFIVNTLIKNRTRPFLIIITVLATSVIVFLNFEVPLFITLIVISLISKKSRTNGSYPILLLISAFWAFSIFAYGDDRIASYYTFPIYILTTMFAINAFEGLKRLLKPNLF